MRLWCAFLSGVLPGVASMDVAHIDGEYVSRCAGSLKLSAVACPCFAQMARAKGDFLLVGLHGDEAVMERRGAHLPIMDLHKRALTVLACRYVNEVIIGG